MFKTQSPEVVQKSGGTDLISAVLDTGNDSVKTIFTAIMIC